VPPRSLRFGGLLSVHVGDRSERYLLAAPRPVNSPLGGSSESVNQVFQKNVMRRAMRSDRIARRGRGLPIPLEPIPPSSIAHKAGIDRLSGKRFGKAPPGRLRLVHRASKTPVSLRTNLHLEPGIPIRHQSFPRDTLPNGKVSQPTN